MDEIDFDCLKSIPVLNRYKFKIKLVEKIEVVIKKMQVLFFSNRNDMRKIIDNFGVKTKKKSPSDTK